MKRNKQSGFTAVEALIILLVLVVLGGAGWYVWQQGQSKSSSSNSDSTSNTANTPAKTTADYTNTKYGFKMSYPTDLNAPKFSAAKGATGTQYKLAFGCSKMSELCPTGNESITVFLSSDDYTQSACNDSGCHGTTKSVDGVTDSTLIKQVLENSNQPAEPGQLPVVSHDASSYAQLNTHAAELDVFQIVSLPNIHVTAAGAVEMANGGGNENCLAGKLAANSQQGCYSQATVNVVSQMLKTIKAE